MNKDERITYEEFMIMFRNAPRFAYTLYDKAEDEIDKYKNVIDKIKEIINNMKPLSLVETSIKEELKSAYNPKESSIKGTDEYFDTVCHLEDFEIQIWNIKELLEEIK